MKIIAIETVRSNSQKNVCFVKLVSDSGLVGLGESFYGANLVERHIHENLADVILALPEATPQAVLRYTRPYVGYQGGGAETRAMGAIDMALWDLIGKESGLSLSSLLGGSIRDSVPTYNTCAGSGYMSTTTRQESSNWGIADDLSTPYEDLDAFLTRPGLLARELFSEGIKAMKIWPFDGAAERSGGVDISRRELADGLRIVSDIRDECGDDMDILIELHGLWSPLGATRICQALEQFEPYWVEDPVRLDALDALAALRGSTSVTVATGETCVGRRGFLPLLQAKLVDIVTVDVGWTGGITEAVRVASLADTFGVPIAPHDCTGPVSLGIATHLVASQPNGLIQESARSFMRTWYQDFAEGVPRYIDGRLEVSKQPGHGVQLNPDVESRADSTVRTSGALTASV